MLPPIQKPLTLHLSHLIPRTYQVSTWLEEGSGQPFLPLGLQEEGGIGQDF